MNTADSQASIKTLKCPGSAPGLALLGWQDFAFSQVDFTTL